jgi:diaminopimelate epimerase
MRIFNADGSEPEMCGNGIRCMARYLEAKGLSQLQTHTIETGAGVRIVQRCSSGYRVAMGRPILEAGAIPVALGGVERVVGEQLRIGEQTISFTALSMGNPHAVIFEQQLCDEHVQGWGETLKRDPFFPKSVNVEFVQIQSPAEITIRVNERGVGETLACGTGACAAVVAAILNNHCGSEVTVHLRGGDLFIQWSGDVQEPVYMSGAAEVVFEGTIALAHESA